MVRPFKLLPKSGESLLRQYRDGERDFDASNLSGIELSGHDISGISLCNAHLRLANFSGSLLFNSDFRNAELRRADFSAADLHWANFAGANLRGARLTGALLEGAQFGDVHLGLTHLEDLNLSALADAERPQIHHEGSYVDFRSVLRSLRSPNLKAFLLRTGMPEVFVEYDISCADSIVGLTQLRKPLEQRDYG